MFLNKLKVLFSPGKITNMLISSVPQQFTCRLCISQKHSCVHPDEKLNFNEHVKEKVAEVCQRIALIKENFNFQGKNFLLLVRLS